jgi:hypothetical protein
MTQIAANMERSLVKAIKETLAADGKVKGKA